MRSTACTAPVGTNDRKRGGACAREEIGRVEGEQLVHSVRRHVALHDEDGQPCEEAHDAGRAPLSQVLGPGGVCACRSSVLPCHFSSLLPWYRRFFLQGRPPTPVQDRLCSWVFP